MSRKLSAFSLGAVLLAGTATADVPRVAVDIAPVHSLVARVMQGAGTPNLVVAPGGTPHEYSLRPSEAAALQEADLVFWVGPDLTPWLADAITTLAEDATVTELLEIDGTTKLAFREGAMFEAHDHEDEEHASNAGDEHGHTDDHGHDDDHGHTDEDRHTDDHGHKDEENHEHAHGDHDPHVWLDPQNASVWLTAIATSLAASDPENADLYAANAAEAQSDLSRLTDEIAGILNPVKDRNFIVFHDAYQYFERAFDIPASGAISVSDASDPSPARIAEIQARVAEQGVSCVLSEPQFDPGIVAAVMDGSDARTGVLDPLGSDLEPGAALYPQMMRNLAATLAECLG